jgi:hypothetical protein
MAVVKKAKGQNRMIAENSSQAAGFNSVIFKPIGDRKILPYCLSASRNAF